MTNISEVQEQLQETNVTEEQSSNAVVGAEQSEEQSASSTEANQQARKKRNDAEYNWAEANRKMKEMSQRLKEYESERNQKPAHDPFEELDKLADDDIVTKAQARKLAEKIAKEAAQQAVRQREAATVDERLSLKYSDFADVVTPEAIEELKQTEPELTYSLANNPDPFAQGVAAYKLIKRLNIQQDKSEMTKINSEKKKAEVNSQKPISVNSISKSNSAIGNAHIFENGLTPELKKQLYKEMQDARKRM